MIMEAASGPPIYRLRAQMVADSYGDLVESWDAPEETLLLQSQFQADKLMRTAETETPSADDVTTQGHLYYYGSVPIVETDRIRVGSEVWRVNGKAVTRYGLATGPYTHAKLKRHTSDQEASS